MRELTSLQHPLVKHLIKLRKNRDYRHEHGSLVIEGRKLVSEVCRTHPPKAVVACAETSIPSHMQRAEIFIVTEEMMRKISGLETPEGLIAEVPMPQENTLNGCRYVLALDGVADPGNVGTLLRSALAFGWDGVFLLENSCDLFNDKALRAARGATFRLPYALGSWEKLQRLIEKNQWRPYAADLHGIAPEEADAKQGVLLVMGNEAHGLSPAAENLCQKVSIPMSREIESLNVAVAGGILMYVFTRGQL